MRQFVLILFLSLSFCAQVLAGEEWNSSSSTHFIAYYQSASDKFVEQLKDKAEGFYNKIADDLGFSRYDFWLWDQRARIYIYDTDKDYFKATGEPQWSSGCAFPDSRTIYTYILAKSFFDTVLPHEMGHIIFREFVGLHNPAIPLWLDEGVASYEQDARFSTASLVKQAIANNKFIQLNSLKNIDLQDSSAHTEEVDIFYAESVNLVEFLINKFGQDTFAEFCRSLRDKNDFLGSLSSIYSYSTLEDLEEDWKKQF